MQHSSNHALATSSLFFVLIAYQLLKSSALVAIIYVMNARMSCPSVILAMAVYGR